ncbi:hypothetical protein NC653_022725 [Populus alba x Populus x berolinensis]|uniref:PAR1 protein n=1 Tax=Populus alba x Populus x berolinensis TaxID=444605 RepID=A0AAD6QA12_9ROSI|nr:hypothetical protein NC653_022725 [Populus alba x Populus x berolinensis]
MADTYKINMAFIAFLALSLLLNGALGELVCEQLPVDLCSYSIATSGKRCLLENYATKEGGVKYQCKTSEPQFLTKLCSKSCSQACPNTVDIYSNLAIAEVPAVSRTRLARSNGDAAPAPVSVGALSPESAMSGADDVACAPASI